MRIEHIKVSDLETKQWSGGTTTQLAIYPENASYQDRNFLFRISTATVEANESVFTKLPGIKRKLMILDGEIKIEHKNHHSKILKKFEQDEFMGDWDTKSLGKATDFNLMTTGNLQGEILAKSFQDQLIIQESAEYIGLYIYEGKLKIKLQNEEYLVNKGDFIQIKNDNTQLNIEFLPDTKCEIIFTRINNLEI